MVQADYCAYKNSPNHAKSLNLELIATDLLFLNQKITF